jgi:hypothetical protein
VIPLDRDKVMSGRTILLSPEAEDTARVPVVEWVSGLGALIEVKERSRDHRSRVTCDSQVQNRLR